MFTCNINYWCVLASFIGLPWSVRRSFEGSLTISCYHLSRLFLMVRICVLLRIKSIWNMGSHANAMNLDLWIEKTRNCQILDEAEMKSICDTVAFLFNALIMVLDYFIPCGRIKYFKYPFTRDCLRWSAWPVFWCPTSFRSRRMPSGYTLRFLGKRSELQSALISFRVIMLTVGVIALKPLHFWCFLNLSILF